MLIMGCVCVCVCQCASIIFPSLPVALSLSWGLRSSNSSSSVTTDFCVTAVTSCQALSCCSPFVFIPSICVPPVSCLFSLFPFFSPNFFFLLISCFWFCYAWISFAFTAEHWASLTVSVGHYPHISTWKRSFQTCISFISDSDSSRILFSHLEAVLFLHLSACCWIKGVRLQILKIFLTKESNPREKNDADVEQL